MNRFQQCYYVQQIQLCLDIWKILCDVGMYEEANAMYVCIPVY